MTQLPEGGQRDDDSNWAPLIDVSQLPIVDLIQEGSAAAQSARRLMKDLDDPHDLMG